MAKSDPRNQCFTVASAHSNGRLRAHVLFVRITGFLTEVSLPGGEGATWIPGKFQIALCRKDFADRRGKLPLSYANHLLFQKKSLCFGDKEMSENFMITTFNLKVT